MSKKIRRGRTTNSPKQCEVKVYLSEKEFALLQAQSQGTGKSMALIMREAWHDSLKIIEDKIKKDVRAGQYVFNFEP